MLSSSKYLLFIGILLLGACTTVPGGTFELDEVEVSMHMVFPVQSESRYYITGTTDLTNVWKGKTDGFTVYSSKDLKSWDKQLAWVPPAGSEWDSKAWGAIILPPPRNDMYLMVGAEEPLMEGIDPAVVTDKDGSPWLVVGGRPAIKAASLSRDLRRILAEPKTILHASEVPGGEGRMVP